MLHLELKLILPIKYVFFRINITDKHKFQLLGYWWLGKSMYLISKNMFSLSLAVLVVASWLTLTE